MKFVTFIAICFFCCIICSTAVLLGTNNKQYSIAEANYSNSAVLSTTDAEDTAEEQGYTGPAFIELVMIVILVIGSACGLAGIVILVVLIIKQIIKVKKENKQKRTVSAEENSTKAEQE